MRNTQTASTGPSFFLLVTARISEMLSLEARPSLARRFKAKPELRVVQKAPGSTNMACPFPIARRKQTNKETYLDGCFSSVPGFPPSQGLTIRANRCPRLHPPALLRRSMSCSKKNSFPNSSFSGPLLYTQAVPASAPACLHLLWGHPTHLRMWGWPGAQLEGQNGCLT